MLGTNAQVLCDRHPLTPKIDPDGGEASEDEEEIGAEEEINEDRSHEVQMIGDQCVDHMRRNQGDRRSGIEVVGGGDKLN